LEYNSTGPDLKKPHSKQVNIFEHMVFKKLAKDQKQNIPIDPAY